MLPGFVAIGVPSPSPRLSFEVSNAIIVHSGWPHSSLLSALLLERAAGAMLDIALMRKRQTAEYRVHGLALRTDCRSRPVSLSFEVSFTLVNRDYLTYHYLCTGALATEQARTEKAWRRRRYGAYLQFEFLF